jgi:hypothetical protein
MGDKKNQSRLRRGLGDNQERVSLAQGQKLGCH